MAGKTPHTTEETPSQNRDYGEAESYLKKDDYETSNAALVARLDLLEARVKDNDCFTETFNAALRNNKGMDTALSEALRALLSKDEDVKLTLSKEIDKIDRTWQTLFFRRIGGIVGALILALVSGLAVFFYKQ